MNQQELETKIQAIEETIKQARIPVDAQRTRIREAIHILETIEEALWEDYYTATDPLRKQRKTLHDELSNLWLTPHGLKLGDCFERSPEGDWQAGNIVTITYAHHRDSDGQLMVGYEWLGERSAGAASPVDEVVAAVAKYPRNS